MWAFSLFILAVTLLNISRKVETFGSNVTADNPYIT